jgi:hypothetical protein
MYAVPKVTVVVLVGPTVAWLDAVSMAVHCAENVSAEKSELNVIVYWPVAVFAVDVML